jgi:hypothetical protein
MYTISNTHFFLYCAVLFIAGLIIGRDLYKIFRKNFPTTQDVLAEIGFGRANASPAEPPQCTIAKLVSVDMARSAEKVPVFCAFTTKYGVPNILGWTQNRDIAAGYLGKALIDQGEIRVHLKEAWRLADGTLLQHKPLIELPPLLPIGEDE